jgi:diadenylate cyclase
MEKKENQGSKGERTEEAGAGGEISRHVLKKAFEICQEIDAKALLIYADTRPDFPALGSTKKKFDVILAMRKEDHAEEAKKVVDNVLLVPNIPLTRMGQIKIAMMFAFSENLILPNDRVVCLSGVPAGGSGAGILDTLVVIEVGKEFEMITSPNIADFSKTVNRKVFEAIIYIAIEIANEGREGKPVGTTFVLGDSKRVLKHTQQMILNPFRGYPERDRNILNGDITETIPEKLPQGWGARHYSAAAITLATKALAVTISQSTGDVRIFKGGIPIMEIEKPLRQS